MSDYKIYKVSNCRLCEGTGTRVDTMLKKIKICEVCDGYKTTSYLVDFEEAFRDIINKDVTLAKTIMQSVNRNL